MLRLLLLHEQDLTHVENCANRIAQVAKSSWIFFFCYKMIKNQLIFFHKKSFSFIELGWNVPQGILCMFIGAFAIYGTLFSTGYFIYGKSFEGFILGSLSLLAFYLLWRLSKKIIA